MRLLENLWLMIGAIVALGAVVVVVSLFMDQRRPIVIEGEVPEDISEVFRYLAQIVAETSKAHGWWEEERSFGDLIALCHTELSEAFEAFRDGYALDETWYEGDKPEGVPSELADVIIRVLDMSARYDIDIGRIIVEKMAYNNMRAYKHGGKRL